MSDSAAAAATVGYAVLRLGVHQALMSSKQSALPRGGKQKGTRSQGLAVGHQG